MKASLLKWFLIPLLVLVGLDLAFWPLAKREETWYPKYVGSPEFKESELLFIGSSRVAAAVYTPAIEDHKAINLGRGYSTTAEHLLGLQKLAGSDPQAFQGKTLFIEAAGGVPEYIAYDGGQWVDVNNPALMVKVMSPGDLPAFWRSHAHHEELFHITIRTLLKFSSLVTYKELAQGQFMSKGNSFTKEAFWSENNDAANLTSAGGIRTDTEGREIAIAGAKKYIDDRTKNDKPVEDWSKSCVARIVELVQSKGGQVVFFETPLDTSFREFFSNPVQTQNRTSFQAQAAEWGTRILPSGDYLDEDFPDVWHLKADLAPMFTEELIRAWKVQP